MLFSPSTPSEGGINGLDKVVHLLLFLALALATRRRFGKGLGWVVLYAFGSELLQALLPIHRDGDLFDALADSLGAFLGWKAASTPDQVKEDGPGGR